MLRVVFIIVGIVLATCGSVFAYRAVFLAPSDSFIVNETTGRVSEISHP